MSVRFRIRTSQGREVTFASHEVFAEFVRSGELSPDDVVYDAETHEWSSALTHPVVLQIEREGEEDAAAGVGTEELQEPSEERPTSSSPDSAGADIGLQLAPAQDLTPAQEAAAFLKKMEAERASDYSLNDEPAITGLKMEQGSSGLVEGLGLTAAPEPAAPPPRRESREESRRKESHREEPRRAEPRREPPSRKEEKAPKRKQGSGAGRKYAPLVIVAAVVVAAGVYFGPELLAPGTEEGDAAANDGVALPPPPPPLIPDTEEALRGRAQERFLATTRPLLRDLPPIPDIWLKGAYLAAPSDYPRVREVWNQYLTTIRQVRAGDDERYRAGYLRALDDARVDGSARTLRLAGAVAAFQGAVAPRAAHYDRAEALAMAALRGHDALVEAEGTISFEPATGTPVSGDPVIEAVGRNPDAQSLLDQVLDMILSELDGPDGPGQTSNVGEWIWDGILDAVTR